MSDVQLLLYGVFRTLLGHHIPLGMTDYLDVLRLLEMQVSQGDVAQVMSRDSVRRVCEVLWARSADEVRLIHRVFESIEPPTDYELGLLTPLLDASTSPGPGRSTDAPLSEPPPISRPGGTQNDLSQSLTVSFESVTDAGGVPLPYPVVPPRPAGALVLQLQTVLPARALAVLWRRYRRMARRGARTELDLDGTIGEWTRRGIIDRPVLRARRVNRARLLILADASPSMAPWRPFLDALEQSVRLSRLQSAEVWYFANVPRRSLFTSVALIGATPAAKVFQRFAGASLLVVSDAGAARGFFTSVRATQTRAFLASVKQRMRSVVWVNPMPRDRWDRTTAGALASASAVTFLPLEFASMIRAVDILRGIKAG